MSLNVYEFRNTVTYGRGYALIASDSKFGAELYLKDYPMDDGIWDFIQERNDIAYVGNSGDKEVALVLEMYLE